MSSDGKRLLSALIKAADLKLYSSCGLSEKLFRGSEIPLFQAISSHVQNYGVIPHPDTLVSIGGDDFTLVEVVEPPEYYLQQVELRYFYTQLRDLIFTSQELLKENKVMEALSAISDKIIDLSMTDNRNHLYDFRESTELLLNTYLMEKADVGDYLVKFGWPTLDGMVGGIRSGDMVSYVGRPAAGKTFQLLYSAHYNWAARNHTPLFISMEMGSVIIQQRLSTIHTHKPLSNLLKGMMSSASLKKFLEQMGEVQKMETPFWVVDGNLATTVDDIILLAHRLKPSVVYVDGAYLLRSANTRMNKWDRISDNAESLKQKIATDLGIPVVCSYQLNRESKKKKSGDKAGLEDIYGSDAIGQLSTVALGLFEEESVETMTSRRVDVLKGRNGETGSFRIKWNFNQMDFSEITSDVPEFLSFMG